MKALAAANRLYGVDEHHGIHVDQWVEALMEYDVVDSEGDVLTGERSGSVDGEDTDGHRFVAERCSFRAGMELN